MRKETVKSKKANAENRLMIRVVYASFLVVLSICVAVLNSYSQTSGAFAIEKSVISSGGTTSTGGAVTIENSIGQPAAGSATGGQFTVFGGFFTPPTFAPTAVSVVVSGRVMTASGRGIRNVSITLTDSTGNQRTAVSTAFGHYRFDNVAAGETVILSAKAKHFIFAQPTIVRTTGDPVIDADFVSEQ